MPDANVAKTLIRVFDLLRLLPKHGAGITAGDIHDELLRHGYEIEKRTVERDLRMLQSAFPDYIRCDDRTKPFGWRWQRGRELCITNIQPPEALALRIIEETVSSVLPAGLLELLSPRFTQARLTLQPPEQDLSAPAANLVYRTSPAGNVRLPHVSQEILLGTLEALLAHEQIDAVCRQREGSDTCRMTLNPAAVVMHGTGAKLLAFAAGSHTPELIALHRLIQVECTHQPTEPLPPSFVIEKFIAETAAEGAEISPLPARISLVASIDDRLHEDLLDAPLSDDQQMQQYNGNWRLQATLEPNSQFRSWVLQQGSAIRIEQPPELRMLIAAELTKAAAAYAKATD
jgi:predicted DNA-binding transcriptional regulator YafY